MDAYSFELTLKSSPGLAMPCCIFVIMLGYPNSMMGSCPVISNSTLLQYSELIPQFGVLHLTAVRCLAR